MKMLKVILSTCLMIMLVSVFAYAQDLVSAVKNVKTHGLNITLEQALVKKFDSASWSADKDIVIFKGKVLKNAVFPKEERDYLADANFGTTEDSQYEFNVINVFKKLYNDNNPELKKRVGYDVKTMSGAEKYLNMMDYFDELAAGSDVTVCFKLSADKKNVEIVKFEAAKLPLYNENAQALASFLFAK